MWALGVEARVASCMRVYPPVWWDQAADRPQPAIQVVTISPKSSVSRSMPCGKIKMKLNSLLQKQICRLYSNAYAGHGFGSGARVTLFGRESKSGARMKTFDHVWSLQA